MFSALRRTGWQKWLTIAFVSLLSAGCAISTSQPCGIFSQQHRLGQTAKELRDTATEPAEVARELAKVSLPPYVVEPGDVLLVQPTTLDSPVRLPADQPVLLDGTIDLGRYGRPQVAGKTLAVIEAELQDWFKDKEPEKLIQVTVRLITRVSKVYYVLGEVNTPGAFPLSGRETVLDGIVAAGGLTRCASERNIILSRPTLPNDCRIVLPICYRDIVQVGDTATNYQLAPGDRIYVTNASFWEQILPCRRECEPCGRCQAACPTGQCGTHESPPELKREAPHGFVETLPPPRTLP